ncbi:MAG: hypothetical protein ACTSRZ_21095 [Promethearchaeota archaeon]
MINNPIDYYNKEFSSNKYILIIEENVQSLLRSIPFLQLFGINKFTYPLSWRKPHKFYEFSPVNHGFYHIDNVKEKFESSSTDRFCMITSSYYDNLLPKHSLISMFNIKTNNPFFIVLKENDATSTILRGFVRPLKETVVINENYYNYYRIMYNDVIGYLEREFDFTSSLNQSMNFYLNLLAFVYYKIYQIEFNGIVDLILYLIEDSLNPLCLSIVLVLDKVSKNLKNVTLKEICENFKYHFELNKQEISKITDYILEKYETNKLDLDYWYDKFDMNKDYIDKIIQLLGKLKEPLRGVAKFHWEIIYNHSF